MKEKENRLSIGRINGVEIFAVKDDNGKELVPIKPICTALGVNYSAQLRKVKAHPIYASVVSLSDTTGSDGKLHEMAIIDAEFVYGWLLGINPDNVSDQVRDNLIKYQIECHHALYRHFHGRAQRQQDLIDAERDTISCIHRIDEQLKDIEQSVKNLKSERAAAKESLEKIRTTRLDDQPTLFD